MDIRFEQVDFTYQPNTPFEQRALFDINMTIKENSYTALVGHTGSGKSTLLQHLNALVKPTSGTVHIGERDIQPDTDNKNLKPNPKKSRHRLSVSRSTAIRRNGGKRYCLRS